MRRYFCLDSSGKIPMFWQIFWVNLNKLIVPCLPAMLTDDDKLTEFDSKENINGDHHRCTILHAKVVWWYFKWNKNLTLHLYDYLFRSTHYPSIPFVIHSKMLIQNEYFFHFIQTIVNQKYETKWHKRSTSSLDGSNRFFYFFH